MSDWYMVSLFKMISLGITWLIYWRTTQRDTHGAVLDGDLEEVVTLLLSALEAVAFEL